MLYVCIICAMKALDTNPSNPKILGKSKWNLCGWLFWEVRGGSWTWEKWENNKDYVIHRNKTAKVNICCCCCCCFLCVMAILMCSFFCGKQQMLNLVTFSLYDFYEENLLLLTTEKKVWSHISFFFFFDSFLFLHGLHGKWIFSGLVEIKEQKLLKTWWYVNM